MDGANIQHLLAMILYMLAVIAIGIVFARRANKDAEAYFLGGRSLGPWVTAFSAEASDMSGYLLMGLPGLAYWTGLADAGWTCIGLALGTYLNFLITSRRLRRYSIAVDAFTVPDFFSKRYHEGRHKTLMVLSSLIIIIFFSVYAAQCLSTCGKLFANLFGLSYQSMMIVAAAFVLIYTFLGGFLAESASDFMQAVVMVTVLVLILIMSVGAAGGLSAAIQHAEGITASSPWSSPLPPLPQRWTCSAPPSLTAYCPSCPAWPGAWATSACPRCCCGSWASALRRS